MYDDSRVALRSLRAVSDGITLLDNPGKISERSMVPDLSPPLTVGKGKPGLNGHKTPIV